MIQKIDYCRLSISCFALDVSSTVKDRPRLFFIFRERGGERESEKERERKIEEGALDFALCSPSDVSLYLRAKPHNHPPVYVTIKPP